MTPLMDHEVLLRVLQLTGMDLSFGARPPQLAGAPLVA